MGSGNIMHMNTGDGKTSYAKNSDFQRVGISKTFSVLDDTLKDLLVDPHLDSQKYYKLADFGCASGPNSIWAITHIVDTLENIYKEKNVDVIPEFEAYLNDLPNNDFNNLFKHLPNLHGDHNRKEERQCFVYGLPGSFYKRLFATNTLHFGYSSNSLHWLSQVPEGLESGNKENICLVEESSPQVYEAYLKQFQRDFSAFLKSRAEEMVQGGRMVLSLMGRRSQDSYDNCAYLKLLADSLLDMATEGLVKQEDLYSFNVPQYPPCKSELHAIVEDEGSFTLDKIQDFCVPWDVNDDVNDQMVDPIIDKNRGKIVANRIRAIGETLLTKIFGSSIIDEVFERYAKKVEDYMSVKDLTFFTIVISLTRK